MKCANCGAELRTGCMYCSSCGKEAQIVPDYNVFDDDDYINSLLNAEEPPKQVTTKPSEKTGKKKKSKKKKTYIICTAVFAFAVIVLAVGLAIGINNSRNNSYEYQMEQANKAIKANNNDSAIKYLERAMELDRNDIDSRLTLANLYYKLNDFSSAIVLYQEIIRLDNTSEKAYEKMIAIYDAEDNIDAIVKLKDTTTDKTVLRLFKDYMVDTVTVSEAPGKYDDYLSIKLLTSGGSDIYYTLDGSDPIEMGKKYSTPLKLEEEGGYTIKAVCKNSKGLYGEISEFKYNILIPIPDMAKVTPDGGVFSELQTITITVPDGCTAYYTWDSTDPTEKSEKYKKPIDIPEGNNVLSVIIVDDSTGKVSEVYRGHFEYYSE